MRRLVVPGIGVSCSVCEQSVTCFCITAQTKIAVYRLNFIVLIRIYSTFLCVYNIYFPWKSPKILNTCEVFSAPEVSKINICMLYCVDFCAS